MPIVIGTEDKLEEYSGSDDIVFSGWSKKGEIVFCSRCEHKIGGEIKTVFDEADLQLRYCNSCFNSVR